MLGLEPLGLVQVVDVAGAFEVVYGLKMAWRLKVVDGFEDDDGAAWSGSCVGG